MQITDMSIALQADEEMWLEKFGCWYCLSNEMSFSHSQHFWKGIAMTTRRSFCFLYCCCAALFWWLNKQPYTVTNAHMNSPLFSPLSEIAFRKYWSLVNILAQRGLDSFENKRKWEEPNKRKSRKLSIISLKDHVGEGIEGIINTSILPHALVDSWKIKSLQTSFTYITYSSISHLVPDEILFREGLSLVREQFREILFHAKKTSFWEEWKEMSVFPHVCVYTSLPLLPPIMLHSIPLNHYITSSTWILTVFA